MHHGVEGKTNPHTGPTAFAAMRQNEVRTTEHNHTPSSKARQPGRHKKQPDTQRRDQRRNWARTPQGTNRRGKGSNNRQGRGADNSQTKDRHKETQPPTERRTTATERHPQTRRQKHQHNENTTNKGPCTRGSETQDQGQKTARRAQPKSRPHQTNQPNSTKEGPRGDGTPRRHAKRLPPHRSKWEQIAMWCPGTEGTGDKRQKRDNKTEGRGEGRGGSLRQTPCSIFKVVLFICSESVSPAVPNCKGDRISSLFPCGMEPQFIAFGLKGNPVSLLRFPT